MQVEESTFRRSVARETGRGASRRMFPRGAWEREIEKKPKSREDLQILGSPSKVIIPTGGCVACGSQRRGGICLFGTHPPQRLHTDDTGVLRCERFLFLS